MDTNDTNRRAKEIRQRAGRSRAWVAAMAGVSEPTATIFELDPDAVKSERKRKALERIYADLLDGDGSRAA